MSPSHLLAECVGVRRLNWDLNTSISPSRVCSGSTAEGWMCCLSLLSLFSSTLCLQELSHWKLFPPELNAFKLIFGNCLGRAYCRNEMAQNWLNNVYANTNVRALFSYSARSSLSKSFGWMSGLLSSVELAGAWFRVGNCQNPTETLLQCIFFPSPTSMICRPPDSPPRPRCRLLNKCSAGIRHFHFPPPPVP